MIDRNKHCPCSCKTCYKGNNGEMNLFNLQRHCSARIECITYGGLKIE